MNRGLFFEKWGPARSDHWAAYEADLTALIESEVAQKIDAIRRDRPDRGVPEEIRRHSKHACHAYGEFPLTCLHCKGEQLDEHLDSTSIGSSVATEARKPFRLHWVLVWNSLPQLFHWRRP